MTTSETTMPSHRGPGVDNYIAAVVQCIVIGPVCGFVCIVSLLPR